MELRNFMERYWLAVADQNADNLREYFNKDASIRWHNTNECFNVDEFLRANCEYPGRWRGKIERLEETRDSVVTVARVWTGNENLSFHVTSFFCVEGGKIQGLDEYWGDDGETPQWRLDKRIGKPIQQEL